MALTVVLLSQDKFDVILFITNPFMMVPVPSVQGLSVDIHKAFALSATDMNSVVSTMVQD